MLNKRQLKSKAYKLILKEKKDHQTAYDQLKKSKSDVSKEDLAHVISKIPSKATNNKTFALRIAFVICLGLVFIIRSLDLLGTWRVAQEYQIIVFLFHGITLPTLGITGALTSRTQFYRLVSVFMLLASVGTIITAINYKNIIVLLFAIPFLTAGVLGFIIRSKIKVPFKKTMVPKEIRGRKVNVYEYFFNEPSLKTVEEHSDLLDN